MANCKSYHLYDKWVYTYNKVTGDPEKYTATKVGVCWGTTDQDECSCGGDPTCCDFYPELRKRSKQETLESQLPERIAELIIKINNIDTSYWIPDQIKMKQIVEELLDIKTILEKRNADE